MIKELKGLSLFASAGIADVEYIKRINEKFTNLTT